MGSQQLSHLAAITVSPEDITGQIKTCFPVVASRLKPFVMGTVGVDDGIGYEAHFQVRIGSLLEKTGGCCHVVEPGRTVEGGPQ